MPASKSTYTIGFMYLYPTAADERRVSAVSWLHALRNGFEVVRNEDSNERGRELNQNVIVMRL